MYFIRYIGFILALAMGVIVATGFLVVNLTPPTLRHGETTNVAAGFDAIQIDAAGRAGLVTGVISGIPVSIPVSSELHVSIDVERDRPLYLGFYSVDAAGESAKVVASFPQGTVPKVSSFSYHFQPRSDCTGIDWISDLCNQAKVAPREGHVTQILFGAAVGERYIGTAFATEYKAAQLNDGIFRSGQKSYFILANDTTERFVVCTAIEHPEQDSTICTTSFYPSRNLGFRLQFRVPTLDVQLASVAQFVRKGDEIAEHLGLARREATP